VSKLVAIVIAQQCDHQGFWAVILKKFIFIYVFLILGKAAFPVGYVPS